MMQVGRLNFPEGLEDLFCSHANVHLWILSFVELLMFDEMLFSKQKTGMIPIAVALGF